MANVNSKPARVLGSVSNPDQFENLIFGLSQFPFFAYIYHDKDVKNGSPVPKHLHFVVDNTSGLQFSTWSKALQIPEHMICRCFDLKSSCRYLIHLDAPDKYQYAPDEIITNNTERLNSYLQSETMRQLDIYNEYCKLCLGLVTPDEFIAEFSDETANMTFYNRLNYYANIRRSFKTE